MYPGQMTEFVTAADGSRIAFDRSGFGPAVILIGGAFQHRAIDPWTIAFADKLSSVGFTVYNYDRRGRGESPAEPPVTLADELIAVQALIAEAGGEAALWGSSSGGAIALASAAGGIGVSKLVLWEVPLGAELDTDGAEFLAGLREKLAAGDAEATVSYFMKDMPPEWLEGSKQSPVWPVMTTVAPSLEVDAEALAWAQSASHAELFGDIAVPTLVVHGSDTLPVFPVAAQAIASAVQRGRVVELEGVGHSDMGTADIGAIVRVVADFLRS
jgi:pimeloyl-ACP methyl ester carboxylesterase